MYVIINKPKKHAKYMHQAKCAVLKNIWQPEKTKINTAIIFCFHNLTRIYLQRFITFCPMPTTYIVI